MKTSVKNKRITKILTNILLIKGIFPKQTKMKQNETKSSFCFILE